jgi:hypothetical protein
MITANSSNLFTLIITIISFFLAGCHHTERAYLPEKNQKVLVKKMGSLNAKMACKHPEMNQVHLIKVQEGDGEIFYLIRFICYANGGGLPKVERESKVIFHLAGSEYVSTVDSSFTQIDYAMFPPFAEEYIDVGPMSVELLDRLISVKTAQVRIVGSSKEFTYTINKSALESMAKFLSNTAKP